MSSSHASPSTDRTSTIALPWRRPSAFPLAAEPQARGASTPGAATHAAVRLPRTTPWHRADLVRDFLALMTASDPLADRWLACCRVLASLSDARCISIALIGNGQTRLVCRLEGGIAGTEADSIVPAGSVAAEVLAANATINRWAHDARESSIGIPIRFGTTLLGALCIDGATRCDPELMSLLESCALSAGARIHLESIVENTARYERLVCVDGLTGIANRRRFDETLSTEWSRSKCCSTPLTVFMIDIDAFKMFNDTYGHPAGDACLTAVAKRIVEILPGSTDLCARYGGDELVVLLPGIDAAAGMLVAESLRAGIAQLRIAHVGSPLGFASLSIGVATVVASCGRRPVELVGAADAALYEAKRAGRNRVCCAP